MKTKIGDYIKNLSVFARVALPALFLLITSLALLSTARWWETGSEPSLTYYIVSFAFVLSLTVSLIAGIYYFFGHFKKFGSLSWSAKLAWTCCALVLLAGLLIYLYFNPEYKGPLSHLVGSFTMLMFVAGFFAGPIGFLAVVLCFTEKIDWYLLPLVGCYVLSAFVWIGLAKVAMSV
jgi:hypothetical protein